MKCFLAAGMLVAMFTMHAAVPPRGDDRLRELVVFPEMGFNFNFGRGIEGSYWVIDENVRLPEKISRRREESNQQPEDVKRLLRLGYALDDDDETNEAQSCYLKAEQLCRKKLEVNPQDGLTMIDLGDALFELDKKEEAENFYRRATLVSTNEWRCWVGLGNHLANDCNRLYPRGSRGQELVAAVMSAQDFSGYQPTSEAITRLETEVNEAAHCYEHALALAPWEPELYFQRAGYSTATNIAGCLIRHYRDKEAIDPKAWLLAFFPDQAVGNLQQAAELSPKNYEYISLAAYSAWSGAALQSNDPNFTTDSMPDTTRKFIHSAMTRLEGLSEDPDKKIAAGALESHGLLSMAFRNSQAAEADSRRAVEVDPTRDSAWDLLLGTLAESGTPGEMVAVCEARLKTKDSAWNHLLLARALQHQKQWIKAEEEAEAAIKLEPDNLTAHLELLALVLQGNEPDSLVKANKWQSEFERIFQKGPYSKESVEEWRCLNLNMAIYNGLNSTPGHREAAQACLDQVLKLDPNDKRAREIADALN